MFIYNGVYWYILILKEFSQITEYEINIENSTNCINISVCEQNIEDKKIKRHHFEQHLKHQVPKRNLTIGVIRHSTQKNCETLRENLNK